MSSWTATHMQVLGSTVSGPYYAVRVGAEGTVDGDGSQNVEQFASPGCVFRPRQPEQVEGADGTTRELGTEAIGVQVGDELIPVGWRDLRLNRNFPAPSEGTWAQVGYGGGFVSIDTVKLPGERLGDILTQYVPYAFDANGTPTKAMAIIIDPATESVRIIHGDGMAVLLEQRRTIIRNAAGDAYIEVGEGGIIVNGNTKLVGGLDVGGAAAQPLMTLTAFSTWLTALNAAISATGATPLTGASLGGLVTTAIAALAPVGTTLTKGT